MVEASGDTIGEERERIMGRITKKLTAAVMAAALLFSGCGKEAQVFQKVEDMMLFGSSPKEAGELLGADFSEAELVPSEDSENLEVYKLPGTWQIGEWEAQASMHFLTDQTPKGIPLGLEMISLEFEKEADLQKLWEYIASGWKLEGSPDWDKDEKGKVQEFSWMSEVLDAEEAALLERISEETFGHPMYAMPYLYMEGRIRKDGSVFLYVFSASGALKHHEKDYTVG